MKILHVIPDLNPANGGPPRVVTRLAGAQAKLGHEVTIAAYASPGAEECIRQMVEALPGFERVRTHFIPREGVMELIFALRARPVLRKLTRSSDVVHIHGLWDSNLRVVAAIAHQENRPYFIQPNGMLDPWSLAQKKWKKRAAMAFRYRRMVNNSAGLCLGNAQECELIAPLQLKTNYFVAPMNSVFPEEIAGLPRRGSFFARYPRLQHRRFILFIGRFHYKKGLDVLADAFAIFARENRDVDLVMIGCDAGAEADFKARIARNDLQSRVHLIGPQHGADKWHALVDAACFVLPSFQEGFSVAVAEALACGVPVIISKSCHFPQVAQAGAGEVIDLTSHALAQAFHRVLSNEPRRLHMARAAQELAAQSLSTYTMAHTVIKAYTQALAGKS